MTLAGSGLRIGELLGLDVHHIDFLRRSVRVERQRYQDGRLGPPKTPQSVRTVPLGDVVLRELAGMLAGRGGGSQDGPLFLDPRGGPLMYAGWKRAWNRALRASGLEMDTHDLRHFYASALISGGASVKQVQTALGHSSAVVTLRVYAHLWPVHEDGMRQETDAALEALADNLRTTAAALA